MPLQSGDDGVLRAMARRYTVETYLRKLEPLADFNLTADVIVGFPAEDDAAFERTLETVRAAGLTKVHVFPYSPRPGTRTAADDPVPPEVKKERSARLRALSDEACRARWAAKVGREDVVLVDRPGRGYGADYSPWLVDAPVGELVRVRAPRSRRRGSSAVQPDCLFCKLAREGDHVAKTDGFVAIRDINPQAETHLLVLPERHVDTFRDVGRVPARGGEADARVRRRGRARRRLTDYRVVVNVGPGGGQTIFHLHWHVLGGKITEDARMSLIAEIKTQLEDAMREGDAARRDTLRLILSSLQGAEKELQRPLAEDEELQVLQRERKKRVEAAEAFRNAGREEQADKEEDELDVLEEFMPEPISEDELEEIVDDVIAEVGATSMRDIGRVMADVMPQVAGRADGSAVSQIVREKLALGRSASASRSKSPASTRSIRPVRMPEASRTSGDGSCR